ncbi:MAG: histidinol-phosphate transaminase [Planctomycetaceae bacterium]
MTLVRPQVARMSGYVPGEQPQEAGWTKLNTNENPYPASPAVAEAIARAAQRLAIYPDPLGRKFSQAAAEVLGVEPDCILPANGSDEVLTILMRTFVDAGETIAFPYPSYILYETLAEIQGANSIRLPLRPDWSWDVDAVRRHTEGCKIVFVPNPNSPSGNLWDDETLLRLLPKDGILVIDEAYRDFADRPRSFDLLRSEAGGRIVFTRTFSKSYSLAGLRLGFAVARPDLISEMRKVKDSYNCDTLSLAAGEAAIRDQEWMRANVDKIRVTRKRLDDTLRACGFETVTSQANFVWCRHPSGNHQQIYEGLKSRKVLVRLMKFPGAFAGCDQGHFTGLRITVGTDAETDRFLEELEATLALMT